MNRKSALLITSAQHDLLSPEGKAWAFTGDTVTRNDVPAKLAQLAAAARRAGIPVIHSPVAFDYTGPAPEVPLCGIHGTIGQYQLLDQSSSGVSYLPGTVPEDGDIVLPPRQGFSAFWAGTIQPHLERLDIEDLYIAGMLAEGCIESHTRDAVANGYRPIVIGDAIGSTSLDLLEASLRTLALHTHALPATAEVLAECAA